MLCPCEQMDKLIKLPAFLRGPAAAHFHSLTNAQKESTAAVAVLSTEQQQLKATLKEPPSPQRREWRQQRRSCSGRCFNCSQRGHFTRECSGTPIAPSAVDVVSLKASAQAVDLHLSARDPLMLLDIKKLDRMILNL